MRTSNALALGCLSLLAGLASAQSAAAQAGNVVTIQATFSVVTDRLRPFPQQGIERTNRLSVTLSGRNSVTERRDSSAGRAHGSHSSVHVLGTTGEGGGQWRVASGNRLVRIMNLPQSQTIITISTAGNSCSIDVQWRLKPGYSEYLFRNLRTHQMEAYGQPRLTGSSCSIS